MEAHWPLTGRVVELQTIVDILASSQTCGVVLAGPAGVGKTRLMREVADTLSAGGWTVRRATCTATARAVPLGAFTEWVDAHDRPQASAVQRVIATVADRADGPLLVCVDDAHLIDGVSALALHQIIDRGIAKVIVTVRPGVPLLDALTTPWKDGQLRWIDLQPLSHAQSAELLDAALDGPLADTDAHRFWTSTRGNILLLRHLVEQELRADRLTCTDGRWHWDSRTLVSPSLRALVESQIGAVPEAVREVVDLVALAEPVDRRLLPKLTQPQALEDAERLSLVVTGSDAVRVGHPLYAEIRLALATPSRLRRLRGLLATALRDHTDGAGADPIRLGLLWLDSDLDPDPDVLVRAAQVAAARQDAALAERLARSAVDCGAGAPAKLQHAYALCQLGRGVEAQEVLDTIDPAHVPGTAFVNDVIVRANTLIGPLRRPDEARRVIDAALADASGSRAHQLTTFRAVVAVMAGRPAEVVALMDTVDFEQLDLFGRGIGLSSQTAAFAELGRSAEAVVKAQQGYRLLAALPEEAHRATAIGEFHTAALMMAGRVADAVTVAEEYLRDCQNTAGLPRIMAVAAVGMAALSRGDLSTAVRYLDPDRLGFPSYCDVSGLTYRFSALYAEALARSGRTTHAVAAIMRTRALRHPGWGYVEPVYLTAEAWVAAVQGHLTAALRSERQAARAARDNGQWAREVICLQTLVQFGETAGVAGRLDELSRVVEGPRAATAARYVRALADRDGEGLDAVSRDFAAMGDLLAAADAAGQATGVHLVNGRRGASLTASVRAAELASKCDGASSPAIAAARVALPITRREREVAVLVSEGLTNREIAETMCLSVRTVECYVQRAYAKTGVSTRAELAGLMGRR